MHVKRLESLKVKEGIRQFFKKSVAIWLAMDALPPLPMITIFLSFLRSETIILVISFNVRSRDKDVPFESLTLMPDKTAPNSEK
jgi:hypothetical protein